MGPLVIAIVVLVVLLAAVGVILLVRQRRSRGDSAEPELAPAAADDGPAPMTGLESALAQVTDRSGRPIREAIDAEAGHVDELRVPDDTGPLLRRALDHVAPPGEQTGDDAAEAAGDEAAADDDAG